MLIPSSWLKEYVDIKLPFPELALKLSEAGLTVEKWEEKDGDIIFDPEVTPNRPDWLSLCGIAREVAALTNTHLKDPNEIALNTKYKTPKIEELFEAGVHIGHQAKKWHPKMEPYLFCPMKFPVFILKEVKLAACI